MKEVGTVIKTEGDLCRISVRRKSACGENCASCKATCSSREHICTAKNSVGAKTGDRVVVETDSRKVLKSAFLVYILPILVFLAVFAAVLECGKSQLISALCAIFGAAAVFVGLRIYDSKKESEIMPNVTDIL